MSHGEGIIPIVYATHGNEMEKPHSALPAAAAGPEENLRSTQKEDVSGSRLEEMEAPADKIDSSPRIAQESLDADAYYKSSAGEKLVKWFTNNITPTEDEIAAKAKRHEAEREKREGVQEPTEENSMLNPKHRHLSKAKERGNKEEESKREKGEGVQEPTEEGSMLDTKQRYLGKAKECGHSEDEAENKKSRRQAELDEEENLRQEEEEVEAQERLLAAMYIERYHIRIDLISLSDAKAQGYSEAEIREEQSRREAEHTEGQRRVKRAELEARRNLVELQRKNMPKMRLELVKLDGAIAQGYSPEDIEAERRRRDKLTDRVYRPLNPGSAPQYHSPTQGTGPSSRKAEARRHLTGALAAKAEGEKIPAEHRDHKQRKRLPQSPTQG